MKNKEKFAKEILEIVCAGETVTLYDGRPVPCSDICCSVCDLAPCSNRAIKLAEWAEQEHIEVDWMKVPVDTPIFVSRDGKAWIKAHFAKYDNGVVSAFLNGMTSFTTDGFMSSWDYAKLAEPEKEEAGKKQ